MIEDQPARNRQGTRGAIAEEVDEPDRERRNRAVLLWGKKHSKQPRVEGEEGASETRVSLSKKPKT